MLGQWCETLDGSALATGLYNPIIRGWMVYFGEYRPSELRELMQRLNQRLRKWAMRKYKKLRRRKKKAKRWLRRVALKQPSIFCHWIRWMPSLAR